MSALARKLQAHSVDPTTSLKMSKVCGRGSKVDPIDLGTVLITLRNICYPQGDMKGKERL